MTKSLILCDCLGSQSIDPAAFECLDGVACSRVFNALCTRQQGDAADLLAKSGDAGGVIIACAQEAEKFAEIAEEIGAPEPGFVDLRDRAGWSDEGDRAGPKMAALAADAMLPAPGVKSFDVTSEGLCLVLGAAEHAITAAEALAPFLSVTVLLTEGADLPADRRFDVATGRLKQAHGALGNFEVEIDALRQLEPGGRGAFGLSAPRDGARSECDVILDLTGDTALFPAPEKREGYLRVDPGNPLAIERAIREASHLVGTFEKPLYVTLDPLICAHSRAGQNGCSKCLDICPTGAIVPQGDHVDIDPLICAGCGGCSARCPSGAISMDDPPVSTLFNRLNVLARTFREAGGNIPRLLVHDRGFGAEIISLSARFGRGLPADVIPLDLERVSGFGHAEMLAALGCGFGRVDILLAPTTERDALLPELDLARALAGDEAELNLIEPFDPDALENSLYSGATGIFSDPAILPMGDRRQVTRMVTQTLRNEEAAFALPAGAPYGALEVDTDACTLCLSCASLCPGGALGDNPDMPQLRFQEDACLQCGLCVQVCPENAISLDPRFNPTETALSQVVVHEEDPAECVECGKPFGVKSTIERIVSKLEGQHSMFATSDAARMIRMCDDCRVNAQFHSQNNPFEGGERPRVRTTDDYLSKRRDH